MTIIEFTDTSGNTVAKYTYDSWGKLISIKDSSDVDKTDDTTFIGYINPLRYRGYYYDTETGLYYLNARYYDPEVGRFISSDETLDGGYNLFGYCRNNPVDFLDYSGCVPIDMLQTILSSQSYPDAVQGSFGRLYGQRWEYGFVIYRNIVTGQYRCGNATTINQAAFWRPDFSDMNIGEEVAGFWHCHQLITDFSGRNVMNGYYGFSQTDINFANSTGKTVFCHTADGRLLAYEPSIFGGTYTNCIGLGLVRDPNLDLYLNIERVTEQTLKSIVETGMFPPTLGPDNPSMVWNVQFF